MLRHLKSSIAFCLLIFAISFISKPALAQPYPVPGCPECEPTTEPPNRDQKTKIAPSLSEQLQIMGTQMSNLLNYLQNDILDFFLDWSEQLALLLAGGFMLFSFLREWRESRGGQSDSFYWWFGRLAICLGLLGTGSATITELADVGIEVATAPSSRISIFYNEMKLSFNQSYTKIAENQFVVKVDGIDYKVDSADGSSIILGLIEDQTGTVRAFNNNLNNTAYMLNKLFALMGAARTILEGGEVWLMLLSFILLISAKIFAPFAIVLAIDRKQASASYAYLYGVVVLTLIWPTVSYFIRGLAYFVGNIALAMGDSAPVYIWDPATLTAFRNVGSQPFYTIMFCTFAMFIVAGCVWLTPVIAFQIGKGKLFETVSNAASSMAGAVLGTVASWYGSNVASRLNQEAAQIKADGDYQSAITTAGGERKAATQFQIPGRQVTATAGALGSQFKELAGVHARQKEQLGFIAAEQIFNKGANKTQRNLVASNESSGLTYALETNDIGRRVSDGGAEIGAVTNTIGAIGGAVPGLSAITTGIGQFIGVNDRYKMHEFNSEERSRASENLANNRIFGQNAYTDSMNTLTDQRAGSQAGAVNTSTRRQEEGIKGGTEIIIKGIDAGAALEKQGANVVFEAKQEAAGITRTASYNSADLHRQAEVARAISSSIAQAIKSEIVLRY